MITPEVVHPPFDCKEIEIDGRPLYVPILAIEVNEEEMVMSWFNSCVRLFPDPFADHVEVKLESKRIVGVRLPHDIIEGCIQYDYPSRFDPLIDEQTLNWLQQIEASHLDEELDEF